MKRRPDLLVLCLLALIFVGCTPCNRVTVQGDVTTFSFEERHSRWIFGGTFSHVFQLRLTAPSSSRLDRWQSPNCSPSSATADRQI